jgi:uncharacterized BrkB/YihY/UPF0761 family membrane protein
MRIAWTRWAKGFRRGLGWLLGLNAILAPEVLHACATCFGKSDAPLAHGMNMGIMTLLAVVFFMWVAFTAFFVFLARRASRVSRADNGAMAEPTTVLHS